MIRFPHANDFQIPDEMFIAFWHQAIGSLDDIPRLSRPDRLDAYLGTPLQRSLEYVCRQLVPLPYRNTAQATRQFMLANGHLLEDVLLPSASHQRKLAGARLRTVLKGH